ncbi:1,25-dihydroxyvitamin D(3) 24-hydroxylase, mitochondrial-like [Halichondria panicea]|uniref:1,25-dihydroxyvitamin D(3) 24-hydroxylase, mitochondrial-like n=1 Tax=Halichondria panicea TaxID=6063 RepID=UPI00312BA3A7
MLSFLKQWPMPTTRFAVRCVTTSSHSKQQAATRPQQAKPFNSIPGPKPLPLLGNLLDIVRVRRRGQRFSDFNYEGLEKYGGIMKLLIPGAGTMVVVADPDVLEEVLRAEGKYPKRDVSFGPKMKWFFEQSGKPPGFASQEGEDWKRERVAANKQVLPRNVNSYIEGLNPIYTRFSDHLRKIRSENGLIEDFTPLAKKMTMEATGKFVFGADLDLLVNPKEEDVKFLDNVDRFFEGIGKLINEPALYKIYKNKFYYSFMDAIKGTFSHGSKYATDLREELERGESSEVQGMLEQWLREKKMSTEEAVALSASMLIAGIHTTANQSTFLLFELARNPEVQERLHQEIQSVVGERPPTAQDLEAMPYLRGCIKESFRVRSTVPGFPRVLNEDAIIHGYHVPAGVTLFYSIYTASKSDKIFEEPTKFKPERWMRKDGPQQHPFSLLPFGFGPRQCYGKRFAELEMKLFIVDIARNFILKAGQEDMKMVEHALVTPQEDVPLYFIDRN